MLQVAGDLAVVLTVLCWASQSPHLCPEGAPSLSSSAAPCPSGPGAEGSGVGEGEETRGARQSPACGGRGGAAWQAEA